MARAGAVTMRRLRRITAMHVLLALALVLTCAAAEPWSGALPAQGRVRLDLDLALPDGGTAAIRVHHPGAGAGPWPVVILSHGLAGSREGYSFLAERWSGHGYVVVQPNHPGSDTDAFRPLKGQPLELMAALKRATTDLTVIVGRPRLVSRLIDALPALELAVPALAGRLDRGRIGVGGHSFGAWTTMCVAGMQVRGPGIGPFDWSDPRPRAFAALSPGGQGPHSRAEDWAGIARPVLVMTGSDDRQPAFLATPGEVRAGTWRRQAFELMPAGGKLLAWFEGAIHSTYSGGAGARLMGEPEPDPSQVEAVAVVTLAWWDAQLRNVPAARAWLADPASQAVLGAWASLTAK